MTIEERVYQALSETGITVTQLPVVGKAPKYLTWNLTLATAECWSSNESRKTEYMITVDLYSRQVPTADDVRPILEALKQKHIRPTSWGPMMYETETRWHHLPITCYYNDSL